MKGAWWNRERLMGALIVAAFTLTLRQDPLAGVEGWGYDLVSRITAPAHSDESVVVVSLDEAVRGETVWPREQARRLLERLQEAAVHSVVLYWPLEQKSYPAEVTMLQAEARRALSSSASPESELLLQRMAALGSEDQHLADAMRTHDQLLLAALPSVPWSTTYQWSAQQLALPEMPQLTSTLQVDPLFRTVATHLVDDSAFYPKAQVVRRLPLFYRSATGSLAPTLPLVLLALQREVDPQTLRYSPDVGVKVGSETIATDSGGYLYPRFSTAPVRTLSLSALLNASAEELAALRGRVVLAAPTATPLTPRLLLPNGRQVAPVELAALGLAALNAHESTVLPYYARWAQLGALLLVALLLLQLLPRLGNAALVVTGVVGLLLLGNLQLLLFLLRGEWLPLVTPLLALSSGLLALSLQRRLSATSDRLRQQLGTLTLTLSQQLRHQGQLDDALFHLQQCPVALAGEELYQLGLDYERKRQYSRAEQVFAHIAQAMPSFRDVAERARSNREASERVIIAGHPSSNMAATLVMEASTLQKPQVGRYQVERELGRGAMGMVYLGHDPKISRTVAIKTVSLSDHDDAQQLQHVRERFFREAESAGRLSHPHIVTIYDVGEEGDLAYIAMDYLTGESLDQHIDKDKLLPVAEVLLIIDQVAQALDYAHGKGVVHRDIKPANIIYDRDLRKATVTDFGVAHLADASKTRTGTILGSPYYMAPEQLAGSRVDGRADLFSLGVTCYQLLTGSLPFQADSIATLMYKITHSRHVSVGKLRRGVPVCVSRIVNQLLHKEVAKRYQSGGELHKALQRCMK